MDKNKRIKILIVSLIIVTIIIIVIILSILKNINSSQIVTSPQETSINSEVDTTLKELSEINDYFIVKDVVNKYNAQRKKLNTKATDINRYEQNMNDEELKQYQEEKAKESQERAQEAIYNMLSPSYIDEFNITKENIKQKFISQNQFENIVEKVNVVQNSTDIWTYFVFGTSIDKVNFEKEQFNVAVSLDMYNNTFVIYPNEYLQKHGYNNLNVGDILQISINQIENKGNNTFEYKSIEDKDVCKEYFNKYKYMMLYNTDSAYEMLNQEYRDKRFGTLQNYKTYVEENYDKLSKCVPSKYQVETQGNGKTYVCLDQDENYYIFNATAAMQYTLMLDTYTVDLPEFTEKYNKASEQEKVALNINKIITALNAKDYKYIYSKLADSFKNNFFENEEALEGYLVDNLFENNDVEFEKFTKKGTLYTYKIKVTKIIPEEEKEKYYGKNAPMEYINVVMQLNGGTDFVMSFSIEE